MPQWQVDTDTERGLIVVDADTVEQARDELRKMGYPVPTITAMAGEDDDG